MATGVVQGMNQMRLVQGNQFFRADVDHGAPSGPGQSWAWVDRCTAIVVRRYCASKLGLRARTRDSYTQCGRRLPTSRCREENNMSIRVSCHGITWGRDLNQTVKDLQTLGFRGFEAFAFVADDYGFTRLNEFKELLSKHNLQLVALYGGGNLHDPSLHEELVARNTRLARFLAAMD